LKIWILFQTMNGTKSYAAYRTINSFSNLPSNITILQNFERKNYKNYFQKIIFLSIWKGLFHIIWINDENLWSILFCRQSQHLLQKIICGICFDFNFHIL